MRIPRIFNPGSQLWFQYCSHYRHHHGYRALLCQSFLSRHCNHADRADFGRFATATLYAMSGQRKQYSDTFKRKVILAVETIGNCAAVRQFGMNECSIRGWRKQKEALFVASGLRSFRGSKNGAFPDVERELTDLIREQRATHPAVNIKLLKAKAREIAQEKGIQQADFKASKRWVSRFMCRAGFSLRRRTSILQKLPESYEKLLVAFQRHAILLQKISELSAGPDRER